MKVALITALIYKDQNFDIDLIQDFLFDTSDTSTVFEHVRYDDAWTP